MRVRTDQAMVLAAGLAACVSAITINENYTMCSWSRLRAGVVRDTVYLDGGELWWQATFDDGTTSDPTSDGNVEGYMYLLNFSDPFTLGQTNISGLFSTKQKAGGAANNIAPTYVDGTMFANNDELYLYGGLPLATNASTPPEAGQVLGYEAYQYGPYRQSWTPGFYEGSLPSGVTNYVTNGAGVNVPSENLGFYFSGTRAEDWGIIDMNTNFAEYPANTLIEIDMSVMRGEKWTNTTLPDTITPRANAELVWIPVSTKGVLVAIGGVFPAEEITPFGLNTSQTSESQSQSPGLMTSLPVYDIASQTWYTQNTSGTAPGQLTEFCSVVAAANDSSSYNVYIYGGYDGLNANDEPSDDVWILSIPSFTWTKAYSGSTAHGRSGHKCVTPYPNQMFVIGGVHQNQASCVAGGIVQVFNLNTLQFQDSYYPSSSASDYSYKVPNVVTAKIGGNADGGATTTAPSTWSDKDLATLFSTKYSQQIIEYYPYAVNTSSPGTSPTVTTKPSSGTKKWVAPVVGVICGLIGLTLIILAILLWRRRKLLHRNSMDGSSTSGQNSNRIIRWVNGMPNGTEVKDDPSVTSSSEVEEANANVASPLVGAGELGGRQRFEMSAAEAKPKPPVEMATPYHFQEHPSYPRSIDYAYGTAPGKPHSTSTPSANGENPNSDSSYGAPSPYVQPFTPEDVGGAAATGSGSGGHPSDVVSAPGSSSPTTPSHSPYLRPAERATTHAPTANMAPPVPPIPSNIDRFSPTHMRNTSSMSSGMSNLPPPVEGVTSPDEDKRRSLLLADLPNSPQQWARAREEARHRAAGNPESSENEPLVSPDTPTATWNSASAKRGAAAEKSRFQESLDEEDES